MTLLTLTCLVRMLREESQLLQEPGSYVGEVVKVMGKNKVLVKVQYLFFLSMQVNIPFITPCHGPFSIEYFGGKHSMLLKALEY